MVTPYPPFPTFSGGISDIGFFIVEVILWAIEIPLVAGADFIETVSGNAAAGAGQSAGNVLGFIGDIFVQTESAYAPLGILAPIAASFTWGIAIMVLTFFIFKAIQLAMAETTEDV